MTTTGGSEHSVADPVALEDQDAPLDGDDIVVEPHGTGPQHPRRRTRELIVGIAVAVLAVAAVAIALAGRHDSGGNDHVTSSAVVRPPAASPTDKQPADKSVTHPKPKTSQPNIGSLVTTPPTAPPVKAVQPTASTPTTPPTAPPVTMPPSEPPSVLKWSASPSTLSLAAGAHAALTITVVNPTAGNVTLPHPLSCAPTLQPLHGSPLGGMVCAEMTQLMGPHSKLVQHYTLYATDTGDASSAPLSAGQYLANIENLHNVKVIVTAN